MRPARSYLCGWRQGGWAAGSLRFLSSFFIGDYRSKSSELLIFTKLSDYEMARCAGSKGEW